MINSVLNPSDCYAIYLALKAHFRSSKYDFFKYKHTTFSSHSFDRRKEKKYFQLAAHNYKKNDFIQIFVSNYVIHGDFWIGDIIKPETIETWKGWLGRIQNYPYWFAVDCRKLMQNSQKMSEVLVCSSYQHPKIFQMILGKEIMVETFIILDKILRFSDHYGALSNDVFWNNFKLKINKYEPFLGDIPIERYKNLLKQTLTECSEFDNVIR